MVYTPGLQDIQKVQEHSDMYEGQIQPSFMQSDDFDVQPEENVSDTSSVGSKPCYNSDFTGPVNTTNSSEESSNYIQNDGSDSPSGVGSSDDSDILDAGGKVDNDMDDLWNEFDDEDLWNEYDGDYDFWYMDPEQVEGLFRKLTAIMNLRQILAAMVEQRRETLWMLFQTMTGIDISDVQTKASLTQTFAKSSEKMAKFLQQGLTSLLEKIQEHNDEVLAEAEADAKEAEGNGWTNFWTSNGDQEDAMRIRKQAREDYEAAMQQTMDAMKGVLGGGYDGLNSEIDAHGDAVFNSLGSSEDYIQYDGNGYIDTGATKDWIVDLRKAFMGILNINRVIVSTELQRESLVKMVNEVRIGRGDLSNRLAGVEDLAEIDNTIRTSTFDFAAGEIVKTQSVQNDVKYLERQIEKLQNSRVATGFANFFKALAIVVAVAATIVISIFTFGTLSAPASALCATLIVVLCAVAAVTGALSATCSYIAAEIQNAVSDQYNPSVDLGEDDKRDNQHGFSFLDRSQELQEAEEAYLNMLGLNSMSTLDDGYLTVNNQGLARINRALTAIQNLQRLLMKCIKDRRDKNQAIFRTMAGLSGGNSGNLMVAAVDSASSMAGVRFSAMTSKLNEYVNARNVEIQQERAMEAARINFIVQMALAVVSAVIGAFTGGATGAFIGWAVGQAVGSAIGKVVAAEKYQTKNVKLDTKPNEYLGKTGKSAGKPGKNPAASMDHALNDVYYELLADGTCSTGDGNIGLDTGKIAALQKRLEKIMIAVSNLTSLVEAKSKTIKSIWQALGVITDDVDSVKDMIQGTLMGAARNFKTLTSAVQEHCEVHNRANAAQQQSEQAWVNFGVTFALLAVSAMVGGGSGLVNLFQAGVSLTGAAQSTIDFAYSMLRAKNDTGELERVIDQADSDDYKSGNAKTGKNASPEAALLDRIGEIESGINMDSGMISDIGGDNWGVNGGELTAAMQKLDAVNRMREILASVLEQKSEIMALVGKGTRPVANTSLSSVAQIANTSARMILQTQFQGIQQLVDRHNQIEAAEQQAIISGISMGFSIAQTTIKLANIDNAVTVEKYEDAMAAAANNESAAPTAEETAEYNEAVANGKPLAYAEIACGMLSSITNFTAALAMYSQASNNAENNNSEQQVEQNNQENVAKNKSELNYGAKLDEMEREKASYAMAAGAINMEVQFAELMTELDKALNQASESLVKGVNDGAQGIIGQIKNDKDAALIEEATREAMEQAQENVIEQLSAMGVNTQNLQSIYTDINLVLDQMNDPTSNTSVLSQQLDQLIAQAQAELDTLMAQSEETMADLETLDAATEAREQVLSNDADLAELLGELDLPNELVAAEPEQTTAEELQEKQNEIKEKREQVSQSTTVNVDGEEMQVSLTGDGVRIQAQDGRIMSLAQYIEEKRSKAAQAGEEFDLEDDPVLQAVAAQVEDIEATTQAIQAFEEGVISSQSLAEAAQIIQRENEMEAALESLNDELNDKQTKPLEEMSPQQLQEYYETIYHEVFEPTRDELGQVLREKQQVQAQMKACNQNTAEGREQYALLQVQLDDITDREGKLRTRIRAFNKHIGQVNAVYRDKTGGQNLEPATPTPTTEIMAPEAVEVEGSAPTTAASDAAAVGSDPVDTVELTQETERNLELVEDLMLETDADGNVQVKSSKDGTRYSKTELETIQSQLEQALESATGEEKTKIENALAKLNAIMQELPDTTGASHTTDAAQTAAAAESDEVEDAQETEEEDDPDGIDPKVAKFLETFGDLLGRASEQTESLAEQITDLEQRSDHLASESEVVFSNG